MAKNVRFWPFYLVFSYSTVTTTLLMLQNVSYHHTEQLFQTWSPHRCLIGLIIAKKWPIKDQKWLVLAISCNFWAIFLRLQALWSMYGHSMFVNNALCDNNWHFATLEDLWVQLMRKSQDKMAKNSRFWPFFGPFFAIISLIRHVWGLHVWNNCSLWW